VQAQNTAPVLSAQPCGTLPRTCETPTALPAVGASETRPAKAPKRRCPPRWQCVTRLAMTSTAQASTTPDGACPRDPGFHTAALFSPCSAPRALSSSPPPVTREDQRRINAFGRLNNRKQDVQAELAGKKARRGEGTGKGGDTLCVLTLLSISLCAAQKALEDLEEASNELLVTDETAVRYLTGECFATFTPDEAETRLQADAQAAGAEVARLSGELGTITGEMAALKKVLYARFGASTVLAQVLCLSAASC
jgi:prefoldin subunit 4